MACALEHLGGKKHIIVASDQNKVKNEWDDDKQFFFHYTCDKKAAKELEEFY